MERRSPSTVREVASSATVKPAAGPNLSEPPAAGRGLGLIRLTIGAALATGLGLAGTALVSLAGLALPGAVAGLVFLALLISVLPAAAEWTGALFDRVSPHMILLFIPAGSGVVAGSHVATDDWVVVAGAVLLGTPVAIAAVALAARAAFSRWPSRGREVSP